MAKEEAIGSKYQVFLSFRGPDTRQGFTGTLCEYLKDAGVRVFRDDDELVIGHEIGDDLMRALDDSKIYVPVFSKTYATSKWCLRELAKMADATRKSKIKEIIPIFYDVSVDDVKHENGLYNTQIISIHNTEDPGTVQQWKEALRAVCKIKGVEVNNELHAKSCKSFVRQILVKLRVKHKQVTDCLVGMDDQVKALMEMLDVQCGDVRAVGIHGMGGIGKTTLAKVVYNKMSASFQACSFIENVSELSSQGLVSLQTKLIRDLGSSSVELEDEDDGANKIKEVFRKKKVLIILDDVSSGKQMEKLAGKSSWLSAGSRILITTRDTKNLKIKGLEVKCFEKGELDQEQALQLFSKHAFEKDTPPNNYIDLSNGVVSCTARLPLSLEIIGSLLYGERDKQKWVSKIEELKKIPPKEVQQMLLVSYNSLDDRAKEIFLDIACLFIGEEKTYPIYMWDCCGFLGTSGVDMLIAMSLLKIVNGRFWMHDHVRDLGREIIRKECLEDPVKRSRIWEDNEALAILMNKEESKGNVKALRLGSLKSVIFTRENLQNMHGLRLLVLRGPGAQLAGDLQDLLPKLRWFSWNSCPLIMKATNLSIKNLVVLDLSVSEVDECWEGWNQLKVMSSLKVLDLSFCQYLTKTPDLSGLKRLERLVLSHCRNLVRIDGSICNLKALKYLNLLGCAKLEGLPEEIGFLEDLEELYVQISQPWPKSIGNLKSVANLQIKCHDLLQYELPDSLGDLKSLVWLQIAGEQIVKLPDTIRGLVHLEQLALYWCRSLKSLPDSLGELVELESLVLTGCKSLTSLPNSVGSLKALVDLDVAATGITKLPDYIGGLVKLKRLSVSSLSVVPYSLGDMESLVELNLEKAQVTELPNSIGNLKLLESIDISFSEIRKFPSSIVMLRKLRVIKARGSRLCELPVGIEGLSCLRVLDLSGTRVSVLPPLCQLSSLQELGLEGCPELRYLPQLPTTLTQLSASSYALLNELMKPEEIQLKCSSVDRIEGLSRLRNLKLSVSKLTHIANELSALHQLQELHLFCSDLQHVSQLPSSLSTLTLAFFKGKLLPNLSSLKKLRVMHLDRCDDLVEIHGLGEVESLTKLRIEGCCSLAKLENLSKLKNLQDFCICNCSELTNLPGMEELSSLNLLDITRCPSLENLPPLSKLSSLQTLLISFCNKLSDLQGLEDLESLNLFIRECNSLSRLVLLQCGGGIHSWL